MLSPLLNICSWGISLKIGCNQAYSSFLWDTKHTHDCISSFSKITCEPGIYAFCRAAVCKRFIVWLNQQLSLDYRKTWLANSQNPFMQHFPCFMKENRKNQTGFYFQEKVCEVCVHTLLVSSYPCVSSCTCR